MTSLKFLTKREKIIFYFTSGIIVIALFFNFIFEPIIKNFWSLNQEISSCSMKLERYLRLLSEKERIKSSYSKISALVKIEGSQEEIIAGVLTELESLTRHAGLRIADVRPQAAKEIGPYREFLIELRQEGTMEDFLRFIYDLENSPHLLRIKRLQLNSKATSQLLEGTFLISKVSLP